jgi:ubiquinone/menaquinone biosynthesis C-methylase UbiE
VTLPLARQVRAVVGIDPEPDMLVLARRAAAAGELTDISWLLAPTPTSPAWLRCSARSRSPW